MSRHASDRGAALIHVAITLIGLFLFSGFVVDYGTFWVARGQAQNAADAGALAGSVARLYDDPTNPPSTTSGKVYDSIVSAVASNNIWGQAPPANTVAISYTCPDATTNCVAVDVYRDGTNNSTTLPTFFLKLVNVSSQGTKAHAVAEAVPANGTGCLRPWFMPDQGWATPGAYGTAQVFLHGSTAPSGYFQLAVDNTGAGNGIEPAIEGCADIAGGGSFHIGSQVTTKPGGTNGPEAHGLATLFSWDECNGTCSDATVNGTGLDTRVTGGCAATKAGCSCPGNTGNLCPNGAHISPRVIVVALCDPTQSSCANGGQSTQTITITNFLTFFVTGCNGVANSCNPGGKDVEIDATLITSAGTSFANGGSPVPGETFLNTVVLIR